MDLATRFRTSSDEPDAVREREEQQTHSAWMRLRRRHRVALAAFHLHQIVPRVTDVREMALRAQILLLRHGDGAIDLDVSLGWLSFEEEAIGRSSPVDFGGGLQVPVAQPDDLIVYKSVAWRDQDRQDIERLLLKHRATIDLARVRARVLEFAQLLEAPERIEQFDALVERTRQP